MTQSLKMTAPPEVYRRRRAQLAGRIRRPIVIFAGHAQARNYPTNVHPFRAGSTYLYYGGPILEHAALVIEPTSDGNSGSWLLRTPIDPDDLVWIGEPVTDETLAEAAGLNAAHVADFDTLDPLLAGRSAAYICPPCPRTIEVAHKSRAEPAADDELLLVIEQRLLKDKHELKAMRFAADVACDAHLATMRACRPERREAEMAAVFDAVLTENQCRQSFSSIVTVDGHILHCEGYSGSLDAGRLLLVDAGAEEPGGYASDITRTYPVTGEFTPIQRLLYDTVLRANQEGIAACKPGARFRDVHDLTARVICEGLVEADLLRGYPDDLVRRKAHTLFFVHGLGHLIGLDVHDMEDFGDLAGYGQERVRRPAFGDKFLRLDRNLEPGMTLTIEPGIYLVPGLWKMKELVEPLSDVVNRERVEELLESRFGGIRVEDTICVTETAEPEVLTSVAPKQADEVAQIVKG